VLISTQITDPIAISLTPATRHSVREPGVWTMGPFDCGLGRDARKNRDGTSRFEEFHVASDEVYLETLELQCGILRFLFESPFSIPHLHCSAYEDWTLQEVDNNVGSLARERNCFQISQEPTDDRIDGIRACPKPSRPTSPGSHSRFARR